MRIRTSLCLALTVLFSACKTGPLTPASWVCRAQVDRELHGAPWGVVRTDYHADVSASAPSVEFALYPIKATDITTCTANTSNADTSPSWCRMAFLPTEPNSAVANLSLSGTQSRLCPGTGRTPSFFATTCETFRNDF